MVAVPATIRRFCCSFDRNFALAMMIRGCRFVVFVGFALANVRRFAAVLNLVD